MADASEGPTGNKQQPVSGYLAGGEDDEEELPQDQSPVGELFTGSLLDAAHACQSTQACGNLPSASWYTLACGSSCAKCHAAALALAQALLNEHAFRACQQPGGSGSIEHAWNATAALASSACWPAPAVVFLALQQQQTLLLHPSLCAAELPERADFERPETQTNNVVRAVIEASLKLLEPKEQVVMRMRYGLDDGEPRTLEEIGRYFKVTSPCFLLACLTSALSEQPAGLVQDSLCRALVRQCVCICCCFAGLLLSLA